MMKQESSTSNVLRRKHLVSHESLASMIANASLKKAQTLGSIVNKCLFDPHPNQETDSALLTMSHAKAYITIVSKAAPELDMTLSIAHFIESPLRTLVQRDHAWHEAMSLIEFDEESGDFMRMSTFGFLGTHKSHSRGRQFKLNARFQILAQAQMLSCSVALSESRVVARLF